MSGGKSSLYKVVIAGIGPMSSLYKVVNAKISALAIHIQEDRERSGHRFIPIQEDEDTYNPTRGLFNRFLVYIPCSQRERKGSRRLAATRLSLYKST